MQYRIAIQVLSLVIFLLVASCASFERNQLDRINEMPDMSQFQNKPSVYIDLHFYRGKPSENGPELPAGVKQLRPAIEEVAAGSNLFSSYSFDAAKQDDMDYTVNVSVYNHGNHGLAMLSGFITGFSYGVIPGAATDNYTLVVKAIEKGNELAAVKNKDAVRTWVGLWFIPLAANTPKKAINNTIKNQFRVALKELLDKNVFKYSAIELDNYVLENAPTRIKLF